MRQIEKLTDKQLLSRVSGAYKKLLDHDDGKLVIRDIVSFAELTPVRFDVSVSPNELLVMEGRRQMAMHILKHLDLDPRQIIEATNDAAIQFNAIED